MGITTLDKPQPFLNSKGAKAFILITASPGEREDVLQELKKLKGLREAHIVIGTYDIIARLETENYEVLNEHIKSKIRKMRGVRRARTLIVI
ncbi:MAG: Lrp/AsnC ligand binding domain-containing protein [Candidatus Bathyarchaeia archaeon]